MICPPVNFILPREGDSVGLYVPATVSPCGWAHIPQAVAGEENIAEAVLFQTGFFVVLHSTRMNRSGQTFQHAFFGQH